MFHCHLNGCASSPAGCHQLSQVIEESVSNRLKRYKLLIHQLNEVRYSLAVQSNNGIEKTFHLNYANYQLNRMRETPMARLIEIEIENSKLREINENLLASIQQVKRCLSTDDHRNIRSTNWPLEYHSRKRTALQYHHTVLVNELFGVALQWCYPTFYLISTLCECTHMWPLANQLTGTYDL